MTKYTSVFALAAAAGVCLAQDSGKEVVDKLLAHYDGVKGASVTMTMEFTVDGEDEMLAEKIREMNQKAHAVVIKPNVFAMWPDEKQVTPMGGMPTPWVYSDGKTMTSAVPSLEMYERKPAPESFTAMAGGTDPDAMMPGGAWQLITGADVLVELMGYAPKAEDAPEDEEAEAGLFLEMLRDAEYQGVQGEGATQHHVLLISDTTPMGEMNFEVHVAAEGEPWLVALVPLLDEEQAPGGMSMVLRFAGWKPAAELPEASKFAVEDDWERADDLMEGIMGKMMEGVEGIPDDIETQQPEGAGEGETAPNFTLETLDGGSFTLADQAGKVVVLDFWATWCPPCVAGLPVVTGVTKEYADKGVVFTALNVEEDRETVEEFMTEKKWNFRVAFDPEGATARAYGVGGIPHSVIIDKKGVVRHVHVGFFPDTAESQLRKELDALIAE